jgi:hypothetical protein
MNQSPRVAPFSVRSRQRRVAPLQDVYSPCFECGSLKALGPRSPGRNMGSQAHPGITAGTAWLTNAHARSVGRTSFLPAARSYFAAACGSCLRRGVMRLRQRPLPEKSVCSPSSISSCVDSSCLAPVSPGMLLATPLTNAQVALQLSRSKKTLHNHASAIYRKLGVCNRLEAVAVGIQLHFIDAGDQRCFVGTIRLRAPERRST